MEDFKPSDIYLEGKLVGTLGKFEAEFQAVWLLKVLVANGDEWKAVTPKQINQHYFPIWKFWKRWFAKPADYHTHLLKYNADEVGEADWLGRKSIEFNERSIRIFKVSGHNKGKTRVEMSPQDRFYAMLDA